MLEAGKMAKSKDLSDFDEGQIVMARASSKQQVLWDVCSGQYLPRKANWWTSDRVMGTQNSLMHMGRDGWPVWSEPTGELL